MRTNNKESFPNERPVAFCGGHKDRSEADQDPAFWPRLLPHCPSHRISLLAWPLIPVWPRCDSPPLGRHTHQHILSHPPSIGIKTECGRRLGHALLRWHRVVVQHDLSSISV